MLVFSITLLSIIHYLDADTSACDKRREFVSRFSGSAGNAVVVARGAANSQKNLLWTDGRYFLQATMQLDAEHWDLMKAGTPGVPSMSQWLRSTFGNQQGAKVGIDAMTVAMNMYRDMIAAVDKDLILPMTHNIVDALWTDRPARPQNPLIVLSEAETGESVSSKLTRLRNQLAEKKSTFTILSALDECCWLLNMRGSDVDFNPVFFSYVIVTADRCIMFVVTLAPDSVLTLLCLQFYEPRPDH